MWVEAEAFAVEEDGSFDVSSVRKPPTRVLMGMILLFISSATESVVQQRTTFLRRFLIDPGRGFIGSSFVRISRAYQSLKQVVADAALVWLQRFLSISLSDHAFPVWSCRA